MSKLGRILLGLALMAVAARMSLALSQGNRATAADPARQSLTAKLRLSALTRKPEPVGISVPNTPAGVWGAITDMTLSTNRSATVVAMADGSASIYWGDAGGIIGGKGQESVNAAAKAAVATMETCAPAMKARGVLPLPHANHVRLYALSRAGLLSSDEIALAELSERYTAGDPLARCYRAVDEVTSQLFRISKGRPFGSFRPPR
jgi:hypothetical protein